VIRGKQYLGSITLLLAFHAHLGAAELHVSRVDEHIYRGKQTGAAQFSELAGMGIKTVLDLRGGMFHKPRERKRVQAAGMRYISIRLSGIWAPKPPQIAKILAVLEDSNLWPIFVHCRRGDDRVGLVIACYRVAHDGWSNDRAYAEARRNHLSPFEIFMRRFIHNFDPSTLPSPPTEAELRRLEQSSQEPASELSR
jgi:tyrosine-protein phosphatase SIW14